MQGTSPIVAGRNTSGDSFIKMTGAKNVVTSFEGWNQSELTAGRSDPQWYNNISYFSEVEGQPNLLLFWVTGAAVEVADCLEDQEVMEAVTGLLRRVTGDLALPSPDRLIRSVSVSI